jgi:predicted secreted protein
MVSYITANSSESTPLEFFMKRHKVFSDIINRYIVHQSTNGKETFKQTMEKKSTQTRSFWK